MSWFKKPKQKLVSQKRELPGEMWDRCGGCGEILYSGRLEESLHVCPNCGHHFRITAESYEALLLDGGGLEVAYDQTLRSADPLGFVDSRSYAERVSQAEKRGGDQDAIRTGRGRDRWQGGAPRDHGLPVHRWFDGLGRGGEDPPTRRSVA